nr:MAG TPA: hypothetical protein [Bacteriophage sp.]
MELLTAFLNNSQFPIDFECFVLILEKRIYIQ